MSRILVVDQDVETKRFCDSLEKQGFIVTLCSSSSEAIEYGTSSAPDLILLELLVGDVEGIELMMELKQHEKCKETLFVFLSNNNEMYSQIAALNAGADDFLFKPINQYLLTSKLKSILRRKKLVIDSKDAKSKSLLDFDGNSFSVTIDGEEVALPRKEYLILSLLAESPKRVYSRDEIIDGVWKDDLENVKGRTIDVHIRKIREKLGNKIIRTIKGVGYRLEY